MKKDFPRNPHSMLSLHFRLCQTILQSLSSVPMMLLTVGDGRRFVSVEHDWVPISQAQRSRVNNVHRPRLAFKVFTSNPFLVCFLLLM